MALSPRYALGSLRALLRRWKLADGAARVAPLSPVRAPLDRARLYLPEHPSGGSRFRRRVCKLCDESDWYGEDWLGFLDALGVPWHRLQPHRKGWEWAQGLYAAQQLGLLRPDASALGVGAGVEPIIFYLTNHLEMVHATDIYGEGSFAQQEAPSTMLTAPETHATIPFRRDRLAVMRMDGRRLDFPNEYFDFVFSFSSIEHFGGHEGAAEAVSEMVRVVKPGGAVVITTELIVNGVPHPEFFLPEELDTFVVRSPGISLIEEIDYALSMETLAHALDCGNPDFVNASPHVLLKMGEAYFTSVCLVFQKPPSGTC